MAQLTAKTVEDVIRWVETTPHHRASWRSNDPRNPLSDDGARLVLEGYGTKLIIPLAVQEQTRSLIQASHDQFDTRMFRATKAGRARLRKAEKANA